MTLAPDAYFLDARTLRRRFPDLLVFAIVRDPLARLASCYRSKLTAGRTVGKGLAREGLTAETTFPEFVAHVCQRGDWRSNNHYRSQNTILTARGAPPPTFIGKFETLAQDWTRLTELVAEHSGVSLPPLPRQNRAHQVTDPAAFFQGDRALTALATARYAEDYRLFYPGQAPS
jgi:dermatan 4-sulfotransferase 1